jgi:hypothetical protein
MFQRVNASPAPQFCIQWMLPTPWEFHLDTNAPSQRFETPAFNTLIFSPKQLEPLSGSQRVMKLEARSLARWRGTNHISNFLLHPNTTFRQIQGVGRVLLTKLAHFVFNVCWGLK